MKLGMRNGRDPPGKEGRRESSRLWVADVDGGGREEVANLIASVLVRKRITGRVGCGFWVASTTLQHLIQRPYSKKHVVSQRDSGIPCLLIYVFGVAIHRLALCLRSAGPALQRKDRFYLGIPLLYSVTKMQFASWGVYGIIEIQSNNYSSWSEGCSGEHTRWIGLSGKRCWCCVPNGNGAVQIRKIPVPLCNYTICLLTLLPEAVKTHRWEFSVRKARGSLNCTTSFSPEGKAGQLLARWGDPDIHAQRLRGVVHLGNGTDCLLTHQRILR
jgi:hypothetical protein